MSIANISLKDHIKQLQDDLEIFKKISEIIPDAITIKHTEWFEEESITFSLKSKLAKSKVNSVLVGRRRYYLSAYDNAHKFFCHAVLKVGKRKYLGKRTDYAR